MKPRLIILVVLAAALAVGLAVRSAAPPNTKTGPSIDFGDEKTEAELRDQQLMIWQFPLPGEEPEEECEFEVSVRVDTSTGKNRLVLEVTEIHGYYVEYPEAEVWYAGPDGLDLPDSPLIISHELNRYLPANETIVECFEVVPRELQMADAEIGTDEHWQAEIVDYVRSRPRDPAQFPPVGGTSHCDH